MFGEISVHFPPGTGRIEGKMTDVEEQQPPLVSGVSRAQDGGSKLNLGKEHIPGNELWTDGLICAFELVKGHRKPAQHKSWPTVELMPERGAAAYTKKHVSRNGHRIVAAKPDDPSVLKDRPPYAGEILDHKWVPVGWSRIAELVQRVQSDASWENEQLEISDSEDDYTVADLAAPYWQRPVGPTWWCHVTAGHPLVDAWLISAHWMHPAIRTALRDESRLISDRMKYLLYELFRSQLELLEDCCLSFLVSQLEIHIVKRKTYPLYFGLGRHRTFL